MTLERATQLLRAGDPCRVEAELVDLLISGEAEWAKDDRDLMVALAPLHDCARRLGADVPTLFRRAAAQGPAGLRATVEGFGRRTDVTPHAFGFLVEQTPDGPRYRSAMPSAVGIAHPLRPSYSSSHQPSRIDRLSPPLSADFIPDVPHASSGRSGLFSHTSQPQYR